MTELYRGLLEILVMRFIEQIESLRLHIRSHNSGHSKYSDFDVGVTGFWNFILETIFTVVSILFLLLFVCLTASLAVVSYPFAALINYVSWVFKNTRNPSDDDSPTIIKQNNGQEKK
jgi:hypothetical protein